MFNILLIPEKADVERGSVAQAWSQNKGAVMRIGKFWIKPNLPNDARIAIYGNDAFSLVLAQVLDLKLVSIDESVIADLSERWTNRKIQIVDCGSLLEHDFPCFIKPFIPKSFRSMVYQDVSEFAKETKGIDKKEKVIKSQIIEIIGEARCFVLMNNLCDISIYSGKGDVKLMHVFVERFLESKERSLLPETFVLDVGINSKEECFIIEFNSAWGAGLNGCEPLKVIPCIESATLNH
jgi:hypothetical protein